VSFLNSAPENGVYETGGCKRHTSARSQFRLSRAGLQA
jgi:hypothetical protein